MESRMQHYAELVFPGIIVSEREEIQVDSRDSQPEYRFLDKETAVTNSGNELKGEPENYSGWIYFGNEYTLEDILNRFPEETILISNMKANNMERVVMVDGATYQMNIKDVAIGKRWVDNA